MNQDEERAAVPSGGVDRSISEVELPLRWCGRLWKKNGKKFREAQYVRRFLILFISHLVDHRKSLPDIPREKLRGRSQRDFAYVIASQQTGEEISTLKQIVSSAKKYFSLAAGAGLSRLLEISTDKS